MNNTHCGGRPAPEYSPAAADIREAAGLPDGKFDTEPGASSSAPAEGEADINMNMTSPAAASEPVSRRTAAEPAASEAGAHSGGESPQSADMTRRAERGRQIFPPSASAVRSGTGDKTGQGAEAPFYVPGELRSDRSGAALPGGEPEAAGKTETAEAILSPRTHEQGTAPFSAEAESPETLQKVRGSAAPGREDNAESSEAVTLNGRAPASQQGGESRTVPKPGSTAVPPEDRRTEAAEFSAAAAAGDGRKAESSGTDFEADSSAAETDKHSARDGTAPDSVRENGADSSPADGSDTAPGSVRENGAGSAPEDGSEAESEPGSTPAVISETEPDTDSSPGSTGETEAERREQREALARRQLESLVRQAEELFGPGGSSRLFSELRKSPELVRLTSPQVGLPLKTAYIALNFQQILSRREQETARRVSEALGRSLSSAKGRPPERGAVQTAERNRTRLYSDMEPREREALKERIRSAAAGG